MTIETAQMFFKTKKRSYAIIDTPGHKEFIKNMITGTSQAEAAILIVDAEKGVEEQTRRHAYVLSLLGIRKVIAVINKIDLTECSQNRFNEVSNQVKKLLKTLEITPLHVIPVSAKHGFNIARRTEKTPWYHGNTVIEALDAIEHESAEHKNGLRYPIQDIYRIKGKEIIVGRIEHGTLKTGEPVIVLPENTKTIVKSIETFKNRIVEKQEAEKGESIGITLEHNVKTRRGDVICTEKDRPNVTDEIKARIIHLSEKPLSLGEKVKLKIATEESEAIIQKIDEKVDSSTLKIIKTDKDRLKETEIGFVTLKTATLLAVDSFQKIPEMGRFVLARREDIIAGGIVSEAT